MFSWLVLLTPQRVHNSNHARDEETLTSYNDHRTEFQKDFDTICNSSSLRRLQSKAQVFPLEREDFSRTRLTHSIEVMSIAESMGYSAVKVIENKVSEKSELKYIKDIPTILKSAALIHDLGNPPFGHIGEGVIAGWFKDNLSKLYFKNNRLILDDRVHDKSDDLEHILTDEQKADFINFDGNAQSLRIINHLQNPIKYTGMNLTYQVMASIIKYPCDPSTGKDGYANIPVKKDYFLAEQEIYLDIQKQLQLNHKRFPLVFLLEASDDIAYLTADIEDACRKRLISFNEILDELNKQCDLNKKADKALLQYAINFLTKNEKKLTKNNAPLSEHEEITIIRHFRAQMKGKLISEVINVFEKNYDSIMSGSYNGSLLDDTCIKLLKNAFTNLLYKKVYYSREIVKLKIEACKIISSLLSNYILSIFNYNKKKDAKSDDEYSLIYNTLSEDFCGVCKRSINKFTVLTKKDLALNQEERNMRIKKQSAYYKLLLAVDHISGMTDTYAYDVYHNINAI